MDRIGGLPDEILCHTLSFLSTKEAALTSLLSNRWRNLFALSPNLHLEDKEEDDSRSFSDFVDRVLAVSSDIPKRKFSLKCRKGIESAHINLWICNLLYRGGLLDLLHLDVIAKGVTPLPLEVFSCKTLVKLKLGTGFVIRMVPGNASLPALKTLFLDCIRFFNHHAFETLLSACHVLEELMIHAEEWEHCSKWYRTVSCKTLQRLTITSRNDHIGYSETCSKSITFDAPNLVYLDYAGYVPDEYLIVNLDSLVEAKLNLRWGLPNKTNPRNLIKGLRNVEILNLSTLGTLEIFYYFRQAIPVLEKLSCLSVKGYRFWFFFPFLLERSPNLETLVIEGPPSHYMCVDGVYEFTAGDSFILPVKVIELTRFWGISGEFKKLKSLVEKLAFLELVKVCAWANDKKAELKVAKDLQMLLPKACKIQLKFFSCNFGSSLGPIPL